MPTVYFSAYKGRGYASKEDIHPDTRRQVERRCEALALAVTGYPAGRIATGVWKGAFEPSFVADHLDPSDAMTLAKAACAVFGQEAALLWRSRPVNATHARLTVNALDAPAMLAHLAPDGYTLLADGRPVFIVDLATTVLLMPDGVAATVEYGTAEFITP